MGQLAFTWVKGLGVSDPGVQGGFRGASGVRFGTTEIRGDSLREYPDYAILR